MQGKLDRRPNRVELKIRNIIQPGTRESIIRGDYINGPILNAAFHLDQQLVKSRVRRSLTQILAARPSITNLRERNVMTMNISPTLVLPASQLEKSLKEFLLKRAIETRKSYGELVQAGLTQS